MRRGAGALAALAAVALYGGEPAKAFQTCSVSATNISFGALGVGALAGAVSTGTINEGCTGGWPTAGNLTACNAIGAGANSASQTNRTMTNGANAISYNLYYDAAMTKPYAYPGSDVFYIPYTTASGGFATTTTYAKILSTPASVPPGVYSDSYATTAQSFIDFNTWNTPTPPITCGTNPWYTGYAAVFTVSVTVLASCSVSAGAMNFGSVGVLTGNVDAAANLTVTCTTTTPYTVALGPGTGAGATTARRLMTGAGGTVAYRLYRDAARTAPWGVTAPPAPNADTVSGVGAGSAQTLTVYGRVPAQTTPPQGAYGDTVLVTLTY